MSILISHGRKYSDAASYKHMHTTNGWKWFSDPDRGNQHLNVFFYHTGNRESCFIAGVSKSQKNFSTQVSVIRYIMFYRFQLNSAESALIASCNDIGVCLVLLWVTYVGGHGHKPTWLGWGMMLMACGSIMFCLPHFIAKPHEVFDTSLSCVANASTADSSLTCNDSSLKNFK